MSAALPSPSRVSILSHVFLRLYTSMSTVHLHRPFPASIVTVTIKQPSLPNDDVTNLQVELVFKIGLQVKGVHTYYSQFTIFSLWDYFGFITFYHALQSWSTIRPMVALSTLAVSLMYWYSKVWHHECQAILIQPVSCSFHRLPFSSWTVRAVIQSHYVQFHTQSVVQSHYFWSQLGMVPPLILIVMNIWLELTPENTLAREECQ